MLTDNFLQLVNMLLCLILVVLKLCRQLFAEGSELGDLFAELGALGLQGEHLGLELGDAGAEEGALG